MSIYSDKLIISGGQIPNGKVTVSGAKNSATRLLAAASICNETVTLTEYPTELVDSKHKVRFLENNGMSINVKNNSIVINGDNYKPRTLDDYFYPIRTTYLLVAGQLKKNGIAYIPYPGGCNIGDRKYDLHIMVWKAFGCRVSEKKEHIEVEIISKLKAARIEFPISTVGGTENALLCASLVNETSEIINAYITPEIEDLIGFLRKVGVDIEIIGNSYIRVTGSSYLKGTIYPVMPDRIEALTWLTYAVISRGTIQIDNVPFDSMDIPLKHVKAAGINLFKNNKSIYITPECIENGLVRSFELSCGTYPGIISDMQPFYVMLGLKAIGISRIHDYRYPERITYVKELEAFCRGHIKAEKGLITTKGPVQFQAASVQSSDLRGTMAAVLAALACSEGESQITGVSMALRGYDRLTDKLSDLGVQVDYYA